MAKSAPSAAAAPAAGGSRGTLGPGETLTSRVDGRTWTLRLDAARPRTYDLRATLAGLDRSWTPCRVEVDGDRVPFAYHEARRYLRVTAPVVDGVIRVTAC